MTAKTETVNETETANQSNEIEMKKDRKMTAKKSNKKSAAKKSKSAPAIVNDTDTFTIFDRSKNYIPFTAATARLARKNARSWLRKNGFSIRNLKNDAFGCHLPKNFKTLKIDGFVSAKKS